MNFVLQPWHLLLTILASLINRQQQHVIEYLRTVNQVLKEAYGKRRIRLNDDQRRELGVKGKVLGRKVLGEIGTAFTPDTILRWLETIRPGATIASRARWPTSGTRSPTRLSATFSGNMGSNRCRNGSDSPPGSSSLKLTRTSSAPSTSPRSRSGRSLGSSPSTCCSSWRSPHAACTSLVAPPAPTGSG
jgi:hypothetical protein